MTNNEASKFLFYLMGHADTVTDVTVTFTDGEGVSGDLRHVTFGEVTLCRHYVDGDEPAYITLNLAAVERAEVTHGRRGMVTFPSMP